MVCSSGLSMLKYLYALTATSHKNKPYNRTYLYLDKNMKTIFVILFVLMLAGCSDKIPTDVLELCQKKSLYSATDYEIDKSATTPWIPGSVVAYSGYTPIPHDDPGLFTGMTTNVFYRKFLGITTDGYYVVQEFYTKGDKKLTDPYLVSDKRFIVTTDFYAIPPAASGHLLKWYPNGKPQLQINFENGRRSGLEASWKTDGAVTYTQIDKDVVNRVVRCNASGKVIDFYNPASQ